MDEAASPTEEKDKFLEVPRQLKLQGVLRPEVAGTLDLKTHFKAFDYREQQMMKERKKE